jgi:hypothetical protein
MGNQNHREEELGQSIRKGQKQDMESVAETLMNRKRRRWRNNGPEHPSVNSHVLMQKGCVKDK